MSKRKIEQDEEEEEDDEKKQVDKDEGDNKSDRDDDDDGEDEDDEDQQSEQEDTDKKKNKSKKQKTEKKKNAKKEKGLYVDQMTVKELKEYLTDRGKSTKGKKEALQERLSKVLKQEKIKLKKDEKAKEKNGKNNIVHHSLYNALGDELSNKGKKLGGTLPEQLKDGQDIRLECILMLVGCKELKSTHFGVKMLIGGIRGMRANKVKKCGITSTKAMGYHRTPEWWEHIHTFLESEGYIKGTTLESKGEKLLKVVDLDYVLDTLKEKFY